MWAIKKGKSTFGMKTHVKTASFYPQIGFLDLENLYMNLEMDSIGHEA